MRICFVANAGSVHIKGWTQYFAERGYDVHIISHTKSAVDNVKVHDLLTISKLNFVTGPIQTWAIIRKIKPDIVHAFQITPYGFHAAFSGFHPLIVDALGSDISSSVEKSIIVKELTKYVLSKADLVHTGDHAGRMRLKELGCDETKIIIQPWGVDTKKFSPNARSQELRKALDIIDCHSIINVCYLDNPHYNVDTIIKAMPDILKNVGNTKLIIAGSGRLEPELKKLAERLELKDKVIFLGGIPHEEIPKYISSVDLYVDAFFPLTAKAGSGLGVSTAEAMACGTPQVVARRPEVQELGEKFGGLMFEPNNPRDLAEKIVYILKNKKSIEGISKLSRDTALNHYNLERNMREWEIIYEKLANRDGGPDDSVDSTLF